MVSLDAIWSLKVSFSSKIRPRCLWFCWHHCSYKFSKRLWFNFLTFQFLLKGDWLHKKLIFFYRLSYFSIYSITNYYLRNTMFVWYKYFLLLTCDSLKELRNRILRIIIFLCFLPVICFEFDLNFITFITPQVFITIVWHTR